MKVSLVSVYESYLEDVERVIDNVRFVEVVFDNDGDYYMLTLFSYMIITVPCSKYRLVISYE